MKRRTIIIIALISGFLFTIIPAYFYLKSIIFYEPLSINISGITEQEARSIKIDGITPFNRITAIHYVDSINGWQTYDNTFLKKIVIFIPDSLESKIGPIKVDTKDRETSLTLKDIKAENTSGGEHNCSIPSSAGNKSSFGRIFFLIIQWPLTIIFFEVQLAIYVLLLLFLLMIRFYKKSPNLKSFLHLKRKQPGKKEILYEIFLWIRIIGFSVIFAFSIFYGYLFFKYYLVTYFTAVLFIATSGIMLWSAAYAMLKIFKARAKMIKTVKIICIILLAFWFSCETVFRIAKINISKNENEGLYYTSGFHINVPFDKKNPHLWVHPPYENVILQHKEFQYEMKCNADGLRDKDHPEKKDTNEYRIICIGDSYTEGIGTPQDSTWPKLLEDRLKPLTNKKVTVFNAGKSGSDPFFGYMLLSERMLKYEPDLVLLTIGFNATNFYRMRGGFERFTFSGYHFREAPWWERLYAISYVCRFVSTNILHYYYFQSPEEYKAEQEKALQAIDDCVQKYYELSDKEQFKLLLLYFDTNISESLFEGWTSPYSNIMNTTISRKEIPYIYMNDYIHDIEKISSQDMKHYFWPINRHCNSKGYLLMARGIEWRIKQMGIIDSLNIQ